MLINAFLILLTEVLLILCGMAIIRLLHKLIPQLLSKYEEASFPLLAILGIIGSTFLAAVTSIFTSIQWVFQALLLLSIIIYTITDRRWILDRVKKIHKISLRLDFYLLLLFSLIIAMVLATSADLNRSYDDGLYHLQSVLLIGKHAAIPGIGLLHNRFAYNSLWHVSSMLWGYQFLHPQNMVYFIITPVLMMNFLLYLFHHYRTEKNRYIQWASLLLLIVGITYIVYYRFDFGSVGNDLPSYILTWLIGLMLVQVLFRFVEKKQQSLESVFIILFTVFAWTVKISTFMLIIPAVFLGYRLWQMNIKETLKYFGVSLSILIPWVIRSLISSGFFMYPPIAKWFGIPFIWQMPYAMAEENRLIDISWAKIPGAFSQSVIDMSMSEWVPQWFNTLDKYQLALIGATILISIFTAFTILIKQKELREQQRISGAIMLTVWMFASILFWFLTYPDPRFFYGPAMAIIASGMISFSLWISPRYRPNYPMLTRLSITTTIVVIAFIFIRLNILSEIDYTNIKIMPAEIPQIELRHVDLNGFTLNLPVSGNQCWGEAVPCIPDKCSEAVYLMGDTVFDGLMFIEPTP